jgi:magnesium-transporting ATPase (P-type)
MFEFNGSVLATMLSFFFFFVYLMCLFWIFSDIFRSKDLGGWGKFAWILLIIIVPLIGMLIYIIARGGGMHDRQMEQVKAMQEQQAAYIKSVAGASSDASPADQIASAKALLDSGAITQEEYDRLKAKALA